MTLFGAPTSAVRDRKSKQLPPPQSWDQNAGNLGMSDLLVLLRKTCMAAPFTNNLQISRLDTSLSGQYALSPSSLHFFFSSPMSLRPSLKLLHMWLSGALYAELITLQQHQTRSAFLPWRETKCWSHNQWQGVLHLFAYVYMCSCLKV